MPSIFGPMELGELIDALEATYRNPTPDYVKGDRQVYFDWCDLRPSGLHSYRGFYDHLAIGIAIDDTIHTQDFLNNCKSAIGQTFTGWKGGEYRMTRKTPVWVSEPGSATSFGVKGVRDDEHCITLLTEKFDV